MKIKSTITLALSTMALLLASVSVASAQDSAPYGMAGCGLGSLVLGSEDGFMQVFAATTNGTSASQTFGITSGTSNCVARGVVTANAEQEAFFEMNFENIKSDMASGQGEYLTAVSSLLGCSEDMQGELGQFSQANYETVIPNQTTTANQALYSYKMALSLDDNFARSCSAL